MEKTIKKPNSMPNALFCENCSGQEKGVRKRAKNLDPVSFKALCNSCFPPLRREIKLKFMISYGWKTIQSILTLE